MLNLQNKLTVYVDKYKDDIVEAIKNMEFGNPEQSIKHTEMLSDAAKGNEQSREYVINLIRKTLRDGRPGSSDSMTNISIDKEDLKSIRDIVIGEYDILLNKKFDIYDDEDDTIGFYQLVDLYMTDNNRKLLSRLDIKNITAIDEFTEAVYRDTYGNSLLESLLKLQINNIEVQGTRKIRVETPDGKWKTIKDYKFMTDEDIVKVATHIMVQDNKGEITEEECVKEGTMKNGYRITIALKPASEEHTIFIKKFDGFKMTSIDDLVNVGEITEEQLKELKVYAKGRANVCIIGGVNSGKTTFMKAYVGLIPSQYKIGMIESDFEAHLLDLYPNKDIVSLAGTKKYSVNELFISMLRMNRHILALGEARSYEVEQLIKAMTRGADGSFSTSHSRTEHDLVNNMAWMALENGVSMDIRILRYRIASAVDIIVRLWQSPTGKRYVDSISEIITVHDNLDMPYKINNIFKYNLDTDKIDKVGNVSKELQEKFRYYLCTKDEIASLIDKDIKSNDRGIV